MTFLHLTPGSAVLPEAGGDGTDEALLLATADERFAAVSSDDLAGLRGVLYGQDPIPESGVAVEVAEAVASWGAGTLVDGPRAPAPSWNLTDLVDPAELAAAVGAGRFEGFDTVVADVLDDDALRLRDASADAAWLPFHRELGHLVLGPILGHSSSSGAPTLTWADVRFRRLAASPAPDQLRSLWRHWSEHGTDADLVPDAASVRGAGRRLLDWLGDPDHAALLDRHQIVVALDHASSPTTHPVLPVPSGLMEKVPG